jgi:3-dehydroquinate synthase
MPCSFSIQYSGGRSSTVHVGPGVVDGLPDLWRTAWREAAIIGDANVIALHGEALAGKLRIRGMRVEVIGFPPGEGQKTRVTKEKLEDELLGRRLDRESCIVAVGGGISLDVAGFVAATYLRGVPYINVPTSLLAQVDAAIGGKTGVNTEQGKNLIGAFHQPSMVLVDSRFLITLPPEEWGNGLSEMVKHAVIADRDLFQRIEARAEELRTPVSIDEKLLQRCVEIKAAIVQADEREAGRRRVLNFGHTLAHGLEHAQGHAISHGRAVAIGMVLEARVACSLCGFPAEEEQRLRRLLLYLGLEIHPPSLPFDRLLPFLAADKKRRGGTLHLALPSRIGEMAGAEDGYAVAVPLDLVQSASEMRGCSRRGPP